MSNFPYCLYGTKQKSTRQSQMRQFKREVTDVTEVMNPYRCYLYAQQKRKKCRRKIRSKSNN